MKKEFLPYPLALRMKELGFDEPCFGWYDSEIKDIINYDQTTNSCGWLNGSNCSVPTFSQAFRWFREKYNLCVVIKPIDDKKLGLGYNLTKNGLIMKAYTTYEKAEQACLDKLIELTFKSE